MKILVIGNTGPVGLGRAICKELRKKSADYHIRALVRSKTRNDPTRNNIGEYIKELASYNVEMVDGDLKNPLSLENACKDISVVFTTATTTSVRQQGDDVESVDHLGYQNLINIAQKMGVEHFVYTSYSVNNMELPKKHGIDNPLTEAKCAAERKLQSSGMTYTILRPGVFAECWLSKNFGFDMENAIATIYGDGTNKIQWISTYDVAKFAVESVFADNPRTTEYAKNRILELGGPEALSPLEVIELCEKLGAPKFTLTFKSIDMLKSAFMEAREANNFLMQALTGLGVSMAMGDIIEMEETRKQFPMIDCMSITKHVESEVGRLKVPGN